MISYHCNSKMYRVVPSVHIEKEADLANALYDYQSLLSRTKVERNLDIYVTAQHMAWEIHLESDDVRFYFSPSDDNQISIITDQYSKVTIVEEEPSIPINPTTRIKELELEHHFFFSLNIDKRQRGVLGSILEAQKHIKPNEKAVVQIIFSPESWDWHYSCTEAFKTFKGGRMPQQLRLDAKHISLTAAKYGAMFGMGIGNTIQELIVGPRDAVMLKYEDQDVGQIMKEKGLSRETMAKPGDNAYKATIRLIAPNDIVMRSLEVAFKTLDGDNTLVAKNMKISKKLKQRIEQRNFSPTLVKNILSATEMNTLLTLPTATQMRTYKISHIAQREVSIHNLIRNGEIPIGIARKGGKAIECHWPSLYDYITLPKVIVGKMGSGKSTYITRYAVEAYKQGHGVIVLDFVKECELAETIQRHVKPEDLFVVEVSDLQATHALSYPEIKLTSDMTDWEKRKRANDFSEQVAYLVNSLNDGQVSALTPKMSRLLDAACHLTYLARKERIYDVFRTLTDPKFREQIIRTVVESGIYDSNYYRIEDLRGLDEFDKDGAVHTKENRIEGILDRLNVLLRNVYLENMLLAQPDQTSFVDLMNEGKIVLVKLRQSAFKTAWVKDVLCTYYLSRVWLATLIRGQQERPRITHVITDEIHQLSNAATVISEHITESRKFGVSYVFSCQFLQQFRELLYGVQGAGAHYMLLSGTHKSNFTALKEECGGFEIEELLELPEYHSFNLIQLPGGYERFISKLPKPLK